mmetsp:Transcript_74508/g.230255  ORF Transcript_74508/g.230255 Transcript_74508/m.230255 type:complete len:313 (+) Transcript_74508:760-1698(+)
MRSSISTSAVPLLVKANSSMPCPPTGPKALGGGSRKDGLRPPDGGDSPAVEPGEASLTALPASPPAPSSCSCGRRVASKPCSMDTGGQRNSSKSKTTRMLSLARPQTLSSWTKFCMAKQRRPCSSESPATSGRKVCSKRRETAPTPSPTVTRKAICMPAGAQSRTVHEPGTGTGTPGSGTARSSAPPASLPPICSSRRSSGKAQRQMGGDWKQASSDWLRRAASLLWKLRKRHAIERACTLSATPLACLMPSMFTLMEFSTSLRCMSWACRCPCITSRLLRSSSRTSSCISPCRTSACRSKSRCAAAKSSRA